MAKRKRLTDILEENAIDMGGGWSITNLSDPLDIDFLADPRVQLPPENPIEAPARRAGIRGAADDLRNYINRSVNPLRDSINEMRDSHAANRDARKRLTDIVDNKIQEDSVPATVDRDDSVGFVAGLRARAEGLRQRLNNEFDPLRDSINEMRDSHAANRDARKRLDDMNEMRDFSSDPRVVLPEDEAGVMSTLRPGESAASLPNFSSDPRVVLPEDEAGVMSTSLPNFSSDPRVVIPEYEAEVMSTSSPRESAASMLGRGISMIGGTLGTIGQTPIIGPIARSATQGDLDTGISVIPRAGASVASGLGDIAKSLSQVDGSVLLDGSVLRNQNEDAPTTVRQGIAGPAEFEPTPGISDIQDYSDRADAMRRDQIRRETGLTSDELDQIERQNKEDARAFRRNKAQGMEHIKMLARDVRTAEREGNTARAEELRAQIMIIRQAIDSEGRRIGTIAQNLRGSLSDLSPEDQIAAREAGRARLEAQLPAIARSAQQQADIARSDQTARLADIGRRAFQLENGNLAEFEGMSDAAFAQYAQQQASPEAIMEATRGVGLPTLPTPGAQAFADRLGNMSSIDFGENVVRDPRAIDAQALEDALSIGQSSVDTPADILTAVYADTEATGVSPTNDLVNSLVSGDAQASLAEAVKNSNPEGIRNYTRQLRMAIADPNINKEVMRAMVEEFENIDLTQQQQSFGRSMADYALDLRGQYRLAKAALTGDMGDYALAISEYMFDPDTRDAIEELQQVLRSMKPGMTESSE